MPLRVTLAGQLAVDDDGVALNMTSLGRLPRLFWAYLICERHRPVARDELADAMWGEDELPRSWEQMLRGSASKLRTALAASGLGTKVIIVSAFSTYQLRLPAGAIVDVEEAASALGGAVGALAAGDVASAHRHAAAAAAVAARGFFPGWSGMWIERRQAELRELHLQALDAIAQACLTEARWADAVAAAAQSVNLEPFRERAYQTLMAAQVGAGNPGEALRAYERCRRILADDLGVSPSADTEAAYLAVLANDPSAGAADGSSLPLPVALAFAPGAFLVGRDRELAELRAALARAPTHGCQAVFVAGEPGIGKSALISQLAREAHAGGAAVLYGRCDEEHGMAYQPFAEALNHYVRHRPLSELNVYVAAYGSELSRVVPELSRRLPYASPPITTASEGDRYRLFDAVTALLDGAAQRTLLVLVLDDLHWAASPTLALLRHLMRRRTASLVLLGAYRNTEVDAGHPLAATLADLRPEASVARLALNCLDEHGVSAFVERAGGRELDAEGAALARALHARTGGNPLFVGEFLRHLSESGGSYGESEPWTYCEDAEGLGLPEGIRDVVGRRLRRLSANSNRLLTLASVVGAEFELHLLERLADERDADTTLDALDEAVAACVVTEVGTGRYQFSHALIRETLYAELTATRRARLHHRVGRALVSLPGDPDVRLPALAYHFAQAAPDGAELEAAEYALAAARLSLVKAAWEDALTYTRLGLAALSGTDPQHLELRFDLLIAEAESFLIPTDYDEAERVLLEAVEAAHALASPERMARALSLHLFMFGPWDDSTVGRAEETLALLSDEAASMRARLLAGLAVSSTYRRTERSDPASRDALALARQAGDTNAIYAALVARASFLADTPHARRHLAVEDELLAIGARADPVAGTRWMYSMGRGRAMALLALGDRVAFEHELELVGQRVSFAAVRGGQWHWTILRATSAQLDGRFDELKRLATAARTLLPAAVEQFTVQMGFLALELDTADRFAAQAAQVQARYPDNTMLSSLLALILAETGHPSDGHRLVDRIVPDGLASVLRGQAPAASLACLAQVAVALGDKGAAEHVYHALRPFEGLAVIDRSAAHCAGAVDRHLGQLAATLDQPDRAQAHFEAALDLENGLRSPPLIAWTRYWYGRLLLGRGQPGDAERARSMLANAMGVAEQLGMVRLEGYLAQLALACLRRTAHRRAPSGAGSGLGGRARASTTSAGSSVPWTSRAWCRATPTSWSSASPGAWKPQSHRITFTAGIVRHLLTPRLPLSSG